MSEEIYYINQKSENKNIIRFSICGITYPDKNYGAFVANPDRYVTALVKCQVPAAIAKIVEDGMKQLFRDLYSGSVSVEDSLKEIETQANEKWKTLK